MVMCKLRYCVANHFLCSCVYDRVCMDHESEINYYYYIIINQHLSWLLPCRGGGACVPLWPLKLCWRERKLPAGPPMPDRSKDRGLTKVVAGRQVRQAVFYASSAAGVGSLSPGARQTVPWLPAGWGRFQLLLCWNHLAHECATAGQPALIPAVMLWHSAGYDVGLL